jgi:hypothetical protein
VDDEDYEKKEMFFVELGEPVSEFAEKMGWKFSFCIVNHSAFLSIKKKILFLIDEGWNEGGKPRLGENHKIEIHIKESKAIKVKMNLN